MLSQHGSFTSGWPTLASEFAGLAAGHPRDASDVTRVAGTHLYRPVLAFFMLMAGRPSAFSQAAWAPAGSTLLIALIAVIAVAAALA